MKERRTEQKRWLGAVTQAEDPFSVFFLFGSTSSCIGHRQEEVVIKQPLHQDTEMLQEMPTAVLSFTLEPDPTVLFTVPIQMGTVPPAGIPTLSLSGEAQVYIPSEPDSHPLNSHSGLKPRNYKRSWPSTTSDTFALKHSAL